MKKPIKSIAAIAGVLLLMSFTRPNQSDVAGIYGVSEDDQSKIELTLKNDFTFQYQDFSNSASIIELTGSWQLKGNKIVLKSLNGNVDFHTKWTVNKTTMKVKSRRGMTFYTLCRK